MQLGGKRFMENRRRVRMLLAKELTKMAREENESPHKTILVIAGNQKDYEHWLRTKKLSRHQYLYLYSPMQLRGRRWENTYLLRLDTWEFNSVVNSSEGIHILNVNFPGWSV